MPFFHSSNTHFKRFLLLITKLIVYAAPAGAVAAIAASVTIDVVDDDDVAAAAAAVDAAAVAVAVADASIAADATAELSLPTLFVGDSHLERPSSVAVATIAAACSFSSCLKRSVACGCAPEAAFALARLACNFSMSLALCLKREMKLVRGAV